MRRFSSVLIAAGLAFSAVAAAPSALTSGDQQETGKPAPFATFEMTAGDAESVAGQAPGGFYLGLSAVRDAAGQYPDCSDDVPGVFYCESVMVAVSGGTAELDPDGVEVFKSKLRFEVTPDTPAGDFDIRLFEVDAEGNVLKEAGAAQNYFYDVSVETVTAKVTTSAELPTRYYLAVIDYWAAVGSYSMDITVD